MQCAWQKDRGVDISTCVVIGSCVLRCVLLQAVETTPYSAVQSAVHKLRCPWSGVCKMSKKPARGRLYGGFVMYFVFFDTYEKREQM